MPPKLCSLCLSHPVGVPLKTSPWKHGLQLPENVTEQQGQFGQVPPENEKHSRLSVAAAEIEIGKHVNVFWSRGVENKKTQGEE